VVNGNDINPFTIFMGDVKRKTDNLFTVHRELICGKGEDENPFAILWEVLFYSLTGRWKDCK